MDEPAPGLKAIVSFKVPDQRSGKVSDGIMCFQSQDIVSFFLPNGVMHFLFHFVLVKIVLKQPDTNHQLISILSSRWNCSIYMITQESARVLG